MKKNLFGAVAAGLALALAITSFGCESGNDDPIARPTDADLAGVLGSTFVYTATPTEFTYHAGEAEDRRQGTSIGSYSWDSYINGVNAYNRKSTDVASKGTIKGTNVGDVILKKSSTFTLKADGTYVLGSTESSVEVFEVVKYDNLYHSDKCALVIPAFFTATPTTPAFAVGAGSFDGSLKTWTPATYTPGQIDSTTNNWGNVITSIETALTATTKAQTYVANTIAEVSRINPADETGVAALKTQKTLADADVEKLTLALQIAKACASYKKKAGDDYVTYAIKHTETVNGVQKGSLDFYDKEGGSLVASYAISGGSDNSVKGKFKVVSGDYKNGKILITADKDNTYDDDAGTYVGKAGVKYYIAEDFPVASTTVGGSPNQKAARELTISNGTLTAPRYESSIVPGIVAANNRTWAFRYASSYTSYDKAKTDSTNTTDSWTNPNQASYSWTLPATLLK